MSISDISPEKKAARKAFLTYFCVALYCGLFGAIYEHFSHGVYSNYMVFLFMFPLIGGAVPYAALGFIKQLRCPEIPARRIYNCGVATLTVGSCFAGVLEIYGTTSVYLKYYWIAGIALISIGIALYALSENAHQS